MLIEYNAISHGNHLFTFPRITVILGANGSGKSTLLRAIKDSFQSVYVEGGRTIKIEDVVQLTRQNFNAYQNLDQTLQGYKSKRKQKLVDRIFDAIMVLILQEQSIKSTHSDAVVKWEEDGRIGDSPVRLQPPLERLFEQYTEVFPHLHVSYDKSSGRVNVINDNGSGYGPSALSDGEKQVFSLMTDLLQLEDEYTIVVVDEPELNLHPELAERIWTLLESEYPDKHFLYATHSIQFALRSQVDALYVLSSDHTKIRKISNLSEMPRIELESFLGGVPGILNSGTVIVTEGHEKSFDSIFFRWLLGDSKTEVFPCGNCHDVKQVINKNGLWGQISTDIRLTGVMDLDFRSADDMARLSQDHIVPLQLHEAESYICLPEVIVDAAGKIGSLETLPTVEDLAASIFQELQTQRLVIALKRSFAESELTVRLSLERSIISKVNSKEEAMQHIRDKAAVEVTKAVDAMSEKVFEERLDRELEEIDKVLIEQNIIEALRLIPGKQLLAKLAPRAGCKNGTDLMRSIKRNIRIDDYEPILKLANNLKTSLAKQGRQEPIQVDTIAVAVPSSNE